MSTLADRLSQSFEDQNSLQAALNQAGLGFRPVLRLPPPPRPSMPPMIQAGGYQVPTELPRPNPHYAFMQNRNTMTPSWQRIGASINEDSLGPLTSERLRSMPGYTGKILPEYHGAQVAIDPPGKRLRDLMATRGVNPPNPNNPDPSMAPMNWGERAIENSENPNAYRALSSSAQHADPWLQRSLANQAAQSSAAGNVQGLSSAARGGEALLPRAQAATGAVGAAGAQGALGTAASFAGRALPILNVAMLAGMLMKQATAGKREEQANQKELMYKT